MHGQDGQSDRKSSIAVALHPVADRGAMQQPANVPALKCDRRHKRCQAGCSTNISHDIGRAVAAITSLCIFGLREKTVGRINHVAARTLRQPCGTLDEQGTSSADKRIGQAESNGGI